MKNKFLHHLQYAVAASILTVFTIVLVRSLEIPEMIQKTFLSSGKTELSSETKSKNTDVKEKNLKIQSADTYEKHIKKGDLLAAKGFDTLAIEEYTMASNLNNERADSYYKIAKLHDKNHNNIKSVEFAKKAYEKNTSKVEYLNLYLETLIKNNLQKEASDLIANLQTPQITTLYYKGIIEALAKNYKASEETFNIAASLSSNSNFLTEDELGKKIGRFINSYNLYNAAQSEQAIYRDALICQNLIYDEFYLPSIDILNAIIKEKYDYRDAWIMLGYSYLKTEKYQESVEAFQEALDIDPVRADSRYFLGLAYFGLSDFEHSINNLEIAIENGYEPKLQALQQLAEIAILNENFDKSALAYEEILEIKSDDIDTYIRPVWLYIEKLNDPSKAVALGRKAVVVAPENAMAYSLLGWALTANNNPNEGYKNLQKAIKLDPNLASAYLNLGFWYQKQEQITEAKENYKKSYSLDPYGSVGNLAGERYNEIIAMENDEVVSGQ